MVAAVCTILFRYASSSSSSCSVDVVAVVLVAGFRIEMVPLKLVLVAVVCGTLWHSQFFISSSEKHIVAMNTVRAFDAIANTLTHTKRCADRIAH